MSSVRLDAPQGCHASQSIASGEDLGRQIPALPAELCLSGLAAPHALHLADIFLVSGGCLKQARGLRKE